MTGAQRLPRDKAMSDTPFHVAIAVFAIAGVVLAIVGYRLNSSGVLLGGGAGVALALLLLAIHSSVASAAPGPEIAWCQAPLDEPLVIQFDVTDTGPHAIWLNCDIDSDLEPGWCGFIIELDVIVGGTTALHDRYYQSFAVPPRVTAGVQAKIGMQTGLTAPAGVRPALREMNVVVDSRPTDGQWRGQLRVCTCLVEMPALAAGDAVEVRARIRPTSERSVHRFEAELFVALPYSAS